MAIGKAQVTWVLDKVVASLIVGVVLGLFTYIALPKFAERWQEPTCENPQGLARVENAAAKGDSRPDDLFPHKGSVSYAAQNLLDGNSSTAWVENRPGLGIGARVTIRLPGDPNVRLVCVVNGYAESWDLYSRNSRVRELLIRSESGTRRSLLRDAASNDHPAVYQSVNVANGPTSLVTLEIMSAYAGQRPRVVTQSYADTSISEIEIWVEH